MSRTCVWHRLDVPDPAPRNSVGAPFGGSIRQARGRLLAVLRDGPQSLSRSLEIVGGVDPHRVIQDMSGDGLVSIVKQSVSLRASDEDDSLVR